MCAKRQQPTAPDTPPSPTAPDRIRQHYAALTASQRQVADHILAHSFEAATLSIDAMAAQCGVSLATMNRFASTLGYASYSSFRNHWQQQLHTGQAPLDKLVQVRQQYDRYAPQIHSLRLLMHQPLRIHRNAHPS